MDFTIEQIEAAYVALGLDPATVESANLSAGWVRIVHADRAVTSQAVAQPEG